MRKRYLIGGVLTALLIIGAANAQRVSQTVNSIVATTCSSQFLRAIAGTGAGTCETVANADLATMAAATIKGRASGAGTGVPADLTATQAATIIGTVGGAFKSQVIGTTFDLATADGAITDITGAGFTPTAAIVFVSIFASNGANIAFIDSGGNARGVGTFSDSAFNFPMTTAVQWTNGALSIQRTGIATFISDGIRITWGNKVGAVTGTVTIQIVAFR